MTTHSSGTLRPAVHDGDHILGPADAPVTLVEYGDFECPHCYRAHGVLGPLLQSLGPQLRFVFRNFPLAEIHPHAMHAAAAAESVAAHAGTDAYWRMHDAIFDHQQDSDDALDDAHLVRYATEAGADAAQLQQDLASGVHEPRVRADFMGGLRSGVNGTPTFFIDGVRFDGDWSDPATFRRALARPAMTTT